MEALPEHLDVDLHAAELRGSIDGDVLTVTIDNPGKRNALTTQGYHGIKRAAMIVADEPGLQFLVVTGTGDTFCAGGDMSSVSPGERTYDSFTDVYDATPFETLSRIPKIVVCKVNGTALGGGLVMTLYADLVIASDRSRFRVPELTRGVAETYVAARLPARVGSLHANHLFYGNDWVDAGEAFAMGLVGQVVPHDDLDGATGALLERVRRTGPVARAVVKRQMNRQLPVPDQPGMWESMGTAEQADAFRAFLDKRDPEWTHDHARDGFIERVRRPLWMPVSDDG